MDSAGYERHDRIPKHKFRYVPFKVNRYERVLATPTRDDGYVFCGGNTRRDFATLIAAARQLSCPFKIVTMREAVIGSHGSSLDERDLPPNIEVIRHDGSDSFLDFIAAARVVALPIKKANISASGIGVYLASMALGKCVVISEGPAVNGVVPDGAAVIVPAEDPAALRAAIDKAWSDEPFRARVAAAGQAYARQLGGEDRLCESVAQVLVADRSGLAAAS
jgi:glycosyltransferase involved in cell wall biosynthesis